MLPKKLLDMVEFLKQTSLNLSKGSEDGRNNSACNEHEIFDILDKEFTIIKPPKMRDWYDFAFEENNTFYPVNIKVSTTKTADNLNCKLGIYYALTGEEPTFNNGIDWEEYFTKLVQNLKQNNKDYYFLIVNKDDTKNIFATSLKGLKQIVPNGNNLPFQVKWNDNREIAQRDFETAQNLILEKMAESLKQRASTYDIFKQKFPKNRIVLQDSLYRFYIECDKCRHRNCCDISNTINGKIVTHYRKTNNDI